MSETPPNSGNLGSRNYEAIEVGVGLNDFESLDAQEGVRTTEIKPEAPNSHGPAQSQLSPELAASLGLTAKPEGTAPALVPADQVKPEDIGTLDLRYVDGKPRLEVSGGTFIPAELTVVHQDSTAGAVSYAAAPARTKAHTGEDEAEDLLLVDLLPLDLMIETAGGVFTPVLRAASEVTPEDIGTLSLRYVAGQPQLVVSGGTLIPAALPVIDGAGNTVAAYTAATFDGGAAPTTSRSALIDDYFDLGLERSAKDASGAQSRLYYALTLAADLDGVNRL
ncbi:hypothetical protein [Streptomyces sp. RerS4]|uniref:hypothetical protein n=1 Tax=Streptomyces sp. RerS4 TaxID=2942449 RepID=UPI00201C5F44|nr:hypothetical protein [Streptomyces sp. RerS4]UQX04745.1 hypothetical protein M4D82_32725 [Streptomyces sp. RerS4]